MFKKSLIPDRVQILADIKKASQLYSKNLVGKKFLYIFNNSYIEVMFNKINFLHLTGVDTFLSAERFFDNAKKGKLSTKQFYFTSKKPYQLSKRKILHICDIATLATSECFMLENISTDKSIFKFGTTDLSFTICFGEDLDNLGNKKSNCLVPYSLRDEDCFDKASNVYSVDFILSKSNDEKLYNTIIFKNETSILSELPDDIKLLIDFDSL